MIKNNKGAILVITIVSMMILTIIGYITLQMVSSQGVMDTYEQTKVRVDYAAEGIVERAKGYIEFVVNRNLVTEAEADAIADSVFGDLGKDAASKVFGYLFYRVTQAGGSWDLFNSEVVDDDLAAYGGRVSPNEPFDNAFPRVFASVKCEFVPATENGIPVINNPPDVQIYKIVGTARAVVDTADGSEIASTVTCYFRTNRASNNVNGKTHYANNRTIIGWRKQS